MWNATAGYTEKASIRMRLPELLPVSAGATITGHCGCRCDRKPEKAAVYITESRAAWSTWLTCSVFAVFAVLLLASTGKVEAQDATEIYRQHCAACHGADRFGASGPALLPESLARLRRAKAVTTIAEGRVATQMPAFSDKLSAAQIDAVTAYLYSPQSKPPVWTLDDIRASRIEYANVATLPAEPVFSADPLNLFVVVETGDHHATILDGDLFEPITRFPTRYALHGGPKFSADGRFVHFMSRDGWVSKYDLWNLQMVGEVRVGLNSRNLAASSDGRYLAVGNTLPQTLVILDANDLRPVKVLPVADLQGHSSRVSAVYDAQPRKSFIVALKDIAEVWEVSYDDNAEPIYDGMVHDYQLEEGVAIEGKLNPRRIVLDEPLDDFFFDASYSWLVGAARNGGAGQVVNLDVRRKIKSIALPGLPHLASGISWERDGHTLLATPNLREAAVSVIDMKDWTLIRQIPTNGPGFFLRSHENSDYAWVDGMNGPTRDTLQVIDKRTLEVVKDITPAPGKTAAHVEFTRDGKYALVSVWDIDGALVVYDAKTLVEVRRIPMKKPSGKYNVYNKITRSRGTSH
jgi:mono/diheme cytochrome c family protein